MDHRAKVPPMQAEEALRLVCRLFLRVFAISVRLTSDQKRILIDSRRLNSCLDAFVVFCGEAKGAFSCSTSVD